MKVAWLLVVFIAIVTYATQLACKKTLPQFLFLQIKVQMNGLIINYV